MRKITRPWSWERQARSTFDAFVRESRRIVFLTLKAFVQVIKDLLGDIKVTPANINALALAMSEMDKTAEVIRTQKKDKPNEIVGGIVYDKHFNKIVKSSSWQPLCAWGLSPCTSIPITGLMKKKGLCGAEIPLPAIYQYHKHRKCREAYDLEAELQTSWRN